MKIKEAKFDIEFLNKYASQFTIGNGYFGIRGAQEEDYRNQVRGMFVSGVYNRAVGSDSSDLVNLPDITKIDIQVDEEFFSLETSEILSYERYLDLSSGELIRDILWRTARGKKIKLLLTRVACQTNTHIAAIKLELTALDHPCDIFITTGIDGQQTNQGIQQLFEKDIRSINNQILIAEYLTTESDINIHIATSFNRKGEIRAKNRRISASFSETLDVNTCFILEKKVAIHTSLETINGYQNSIDDLENSGTYDELITFSRKYWDDFWSNHRIVIESENNFDQLALDFACYHLQIMTPREGDKMSIGAKGLTGEGYKGHVFWDTEIFILPFFLHNFPQIAKNLLAYRFNNLNGALDKASQYGYEGALFPWESAYSGEEETPEYAALNIRTGTRQKVASSLAEHHIVADIAYAVQNYYVATGDYEFMDLMGNTLIEKTAQFWLSRTKEVNNRLEIHGVIGPDEYTEYIDNNAYTNYMAKYNVELALTYAVGNSEFQKKCQYFLENIYLPSPNEDLLIPQDDTFLRKPEIDLTKYKNQQGSQSILLDYSRNEINELQISKQADLVMLFYLFPELFDEEITAINLSYYERRTIHDSSLSKAIHAIEACRAKNITGAYNLFREACLIDLGDSPHTSDEGLHAASLGSLWLASIIGFAGITTSTDYLSINPTLPKEWRKLSFNFIWKNQKFNIEITHDTIKVSKSSHDAITVNIYGDCITLQNELIWKRRE